jgi:hypothetical protein
MKLAFKEGQVVLSTRNVSLLADAAGALTLEEEREAVRSLSPGEISSLTLPVDMFLTSGETTLDLLKGWRKD